MEANQKLIVATTLLILNVINAAITSEPYQENNISGRGIDPKGMLSSLAGSLMSRGYVPSANGASQVVSLNLTNLFVLILLKALIFAAGSLGAGTWKGGYARSVDGEERLLTDEEILMFISYLTGAPGDYGCLKSIACRDPEQAKRYATAGEMLLKATKTISVKPDVSYEYALRELEEAANAGANGEDCAKYTCGSDVNFSNT